MMKELQIPFLPAADFAGCAPVAIDSYAWDENGYRPQAQVWACMTPDGLSVRMRCEEAKPFARYTENESPVYEDSCMECFLCADFEPDTAPAYINLECNANGAFLCHFGPKGNRGAVTLRGWPDPDVRVTKGDGFWQIDARFPKELLLGAFGFDPCRSGAQFRANFYKCGDKTEKPHFGSWSPIVSDRPNFHLPEFFGRVLVR